MAEEPTRLDISDEMIAERRGSSGKMPDDMPKWMASSITKIDLFSKWVGNIVCWITIPLIFAMVFEVFARKLFIAHTMWAYDMSRFLYGALFMLGAGYALSKGVHIRADFLYRNFKVKKSRSCRFLFIYIILFSRTVSFFIYDYWLCPRINNEGRERNGHGLDAILVANKIMFVNWNYFFTYSRNFRII